MGVSLYETPVSSCEVVIDAAVAIAKLNPGGNACVLLVAGGPVYR
jgi:hypothetical protein